MTDVTKVVTNWRANTLGHHEMSTAYLHQLDTRQDIVTVLDALDAIAFDLGSRGDAGAAVYTAYRYGALHEKAKIQKGGA